MQDVTVWQGSVKYTYTYLSVAKNNYFYKLVRMYMYTYMLYAHIVYDRAARDHL